MLIASLLLNAALFQASIQKLEPLPKDIYPFDIASMNESTLYPSQQNAWKIGGDNKGRSYLELSDSETEATEKPNEYNPPHRSPKRIALLAESSFGNFVLELEVLQTGRDYGHRDLCFLFGFQDPSNYYYVHLATKPDPHASNIFLVDDAPRVALAPIPSSGVDWGQDQWHKVKITRSLETGLIRVYFDNMEEPYLEWKDKTHGVGHIGFGSFDDTGRFSEIKVTSKLREKSLFSKNPFLNRGSEGKDN